jgi:hypothetical protein
MPELEEVLGTLIRSTSEVSFEMPSEIRRRGEHRRLVRRTVITGLVVVSVVGIGLGSAWALSGPSPAPDVATSSPPVASAPTTKPPTSAPTTTTTPPPTTPPPVTPTPSHGEVAPPKSIPAAAMLQPSDVGSGYAASDSQQGDDHGAIGMMMSYCGEGDYTNADDHRVVNRKRNVDRDDGRYVLVEVSGYQETWAARHMEDLRAVLPRCTTVDIMGDPNQRATLTVVDTDFAGDGAILVEETRNGVVQYHAVVRQADVEARLRIHIGTTQSQARAIVVAAAGRLCNATPSC